MSLHHAAAILLDAEWRRARRQYQAAMDDYQITTWDAHGWIVNGRTLHDVACPPLRPCLASHIVFNRCSLVRSSASARGPRTRADSSIHLPPCWVCWRGLWMPQEPRPGPSQRGRAWPSSKSTSTNATDIGTATATARTPPPTENSNSIPISNTA